MKKILGILLISVVVIFLGRDVIVKAAIGKVARAATGLNVSVGGFHSSLLSSSLGIKDLKVFNPSSYSEKTMIHVPDAFVQVDSGTLFSGNPHIKELRLDLATLVIERNKEGKLNLQELKPAGAQKKGEVPHGPGPKIRIDLLKLKIGKVIYKDFSKPLPISQEFELGIDETYRNIEDVRALMPIIMSNALRSQALRALTHFSPADLLQNFQASGINIADFGMDKISGALDSGLSQTAQGVVTSVVDQLGSLFGSSKKS